MWSAACAHRVRHRARTDGTARLVTLLLLGAGAGTDLDAQWRADPTPIVDFRGTLPDGKLAFGVATTGTRLPNGVIAIGDPSSTSVRLFTPGGQPLKEVGRLGDGPGEFRVVMSLTNCGADSAYVWDAANQRVTVLSADGSIGRTFRFEGADSVLTRRTMTMLCSRRGFVLVGFPTGRQPIETPGIFATRIPLALVDRAGRFTRQLAEVSGGEWAARGGAFPRPLGRTTSVAATADRIYVGTADSAAIDVYLPDDARRSIRLDVRARTPSAANVAAAREAIALLAPAAVQERARESISAVPIPAQLPPYSRLFANADGYVFVQLSAPGDPETHLRVIGPDDRAAGDVRIPRPLTIFEIGRDYILGSYTDANDEPHVVVYRLHRI